MSAAGAGSGPAPDSPPKSLRRDLALLALVGLALYLPGIGARELWNPDEPRYAQVAREMLAGGQWFVPHLNGDVYSQKPPLLFWLIALCGQLLGGVDAVAARVPSLLAAIAALLATFRLAADVGGRRAGWIAALLFGGCSKILWQARVGQIDMLLIALVAWTFWCWTRALAAADDRARSPTMFALTGFALAGLGTLAKGPVSLLPPLLGIVLFAAWSRSVAPLRSLRAGRGLLIYVAVILGWLGPALASGGWTYIEQIAFRQTVTRYAEPWHHFQPWHYYLQVLPVDFFPASLLLPAALAAGLHLDGERGRRFRLLLCWAVATLLFFSVSPAKRTVYILTLYPGLAAALALGLESVRERWPRERRLTIWPFGLVAILFGAVALALPFWAPRRPEVGMVGQAAVWVVVVATAITALAAAWAWRQAHHEQLVRAVAGWTAGMGLFAALACVWVLPRLDGVKSPRALARAFVERAGPGEPYAILPRFDANVLFHVGRPAELITDEVSLRAYLSRPERSWLFAKRSALAKWENLPRLTEEARDADERDGYLLLRTEAVAEPGPAITEVPPPAPAGAR